jgi:hypothetical protein
MIDQDMKSILTHCLNLDLLQRCRLHSSLGVKDELKVERAGGRKDKNLVQIEAKAIERAKQCTNVPWLASSQVAKTRR